MLPGFVQVEVDLSVDCESSKLNIYFWIGYIDFMIDKNKDDFSFFFVGTSKQALPVYPDFSLAWEPLYFMFADHLLMAHLPFGIHYWHVMQCDKFIRFCMIYTVMWHLLGVKLSESQADFKGLFHLYTLCLRGNWQFSASWLWNVGVC